VLVGCSGEPAREEEQGVQETAPAPQPIVPEFRSILPQEAFALRDREKELLVVDVRTPEELELLRIPGSIAIPMAELMQGQAQLPKDKPVLLVCAVGGRSYAAGLYLVKEKFLRVYNLRGGISAWQKAGLPLEYGRK
jgi:rhodanese-related sulfurtransferase